jgi:hypothetical protein
MKKKFELCKEIQENLEHLKYKKLECLGKLNFNTVDLKNKEINEIDKQMNDLNKLSRFHFLFESNFEVLLLIYEKLNKTEQDDVYRKFIETYLNPQENNITNLEELYKIIPSVKTEWGSIHSNKNPDKFLSKLTQEQQDVLREKTEKLTKKNNELEEKKNKTEQPNQTLEFKAIDFFELKIQQQQFQKKLNKKEHVEKKSAFNSDEESNFSFIENEKNERSVISFSSNNSSKKSYNTDDNKKIEEELKELREYKRKQEEKESNQKQASF